jgi:transposase-like protein
MVRTGVQRNQSGLVQRYFCKSCGYKFNDRESFEKLRNNPTLLLIGVDLFFLGLSTRQIARHLSSNYASEASHVTVYRWILKTTRTLQQVEKKLMPTASLGRKWHADETEAKAGGRTAYVWNVMDASSRYLLASYLSSKRDAMTFNKLLKRIVSCTRSNPETLVTDGLSSYKKALKDSSTMRHISGNKFTDNANNNLIERLNRTVKRRLRLMDHFGNVNTGRTVVEGHRLYYNFVRPHMALGNMSPIEKAGVRRLSRNPLLEKMRTQRRGSTDDRIDDLSKEFLL